MTLFAVLTLLVAPSLLGWLVASARIGRTPAWRALHLGLAFLAALALTYTYVAAAGGSDRMDGIRDWVWSWNLFVGNSRSFPAPAEYEPWDKHVLYYWGWLVPPLVALSVVLAVLEYVDSKSGLELLERVRKLVLR
jgi:hypothetical protein